MNGYESIDTWIDRQPWPDETKARAHALHKRRMRTSLNPMRLVEWQRWADKDMEQAR